MEKEKNSKNIMDYATVTLLDAENAIDIIEKWQKIIYEQ